MMVVVVGVLCGNATLLGWMPQKTLATYCGSSGSFWETSTLEQIKSTKKTYHKIIFHESINM